MLILRFGVFFDIGEDLLKIVGELDVLWDVRRSPSIPIAAA